MHRLVRATLLTGLLLVLLCPTLSGCNRVEPAVKVGVSLDTVEPAYLLNSAVLVEVRAVIASSPRLNVSQKIGSGSGVIVQVDKQGSKVMTASHVCSAANPAPAEFLLDNVSGDDSVYAEVLWQDVKTDVCVLWTPGHLGPAVPVASVAPPLGAMVYYPGAPLGLFGDGVGFLEQAHFAGSLVLTDIQVRKFLLSGTTTHGASGAGVFYRGKLIGLISGVLQESGYIVAAADLDAVKAAMNATKFLLPKSLRR